MWPSIWKVLRWIIVVPVLFQFIRWMFSSLFLGLHRFFRSSKKVRERKIEAYDEFYQQRDEITEDFLTTHGAFVLQMIMEEQRSRYMSVETLKRFMTVYCINAESMRAVVDCRSWSMIDVENIELELNVKFERHHTDQVRTDKYEKMIAKDYHGAADDDEDEVKVCISDLMCADAATSPSMKTDRW